MIIEDYAFELKDSHLRFEVEAGEHLSAIKWT